MKICHISDTHSSDVHNKLQILECDVLIHSGDIGGRTTPKELAEFLHWFNQQPAKVKIFIAGNHDICLDKQWISKQRTVGTVEYLLAKQNYEDSVSLIEAYPDIKYLNQKDYVYKGVKFYGIPYSPSFHRDRWVFNADAGIEMQKHISRIPTDVNVLIAHTPLHGILDLAQRLRLEEPEHIGSIDMRNVIIKRLHNLKLYCCGHAHENVGYVTQPISRTRYINVSNAAVVAHDWKQIITTPIIITI